MKTSPSGVRDESINYKKAMYLMKRVLSSSLVFLNTLMIVTLPTASYSQSKSIDLTGTWIGEGYGCETNGLVEQIQINVKDHYLVAKKITGDNCVPAGNITFPGTIPISLSNGSSFPVTCTGGQPNSPASSKTIYALTILNIDSFSLNGIKFTRVISPYMSKRHKKSGQ